MKKTWQVINDTLSRNKKDKSLPEYIIIDGEKITEHKEISICMYYCWYVSLCM